MKTAIPISLQILSTSAEFFQAMEECVKNAQLQQIAGLNFIFTRCHREGSSVRGTLTEIYIAERGPWTGEGLPPAGTDCEHRTGPGMSWTLATVLAHGKHKVFYRDSNGHEWTRLYDEIEFRPIRTPEQIAADEREAGITQMRESVGSLNTHPFAELWDAGYRKQVQP